MIIDDASLVIYPVGSGVPGKIYAAKPDDGTGDLNFTRVGGAVETGPDGLHKEVESDVARVDFSNGCGKFMFEPLSANMLWHSRDKSNAVWLKIALGTGSVPVVTPNYAIGIKGEMTADRIQFNAGAGVTEVDYSSLRQSISVITGLYYGFSMWLKSNTGANQRVRMLVNSATAYADFDVTTEWVRYSVIDLSPVSGARNWGLDVRGSFGVTADILVDNFQLEENVRTITSDIFTTGGSASRIADDSTTSGLNAKIGQAEGTIAIKLTAQIANNTAIQRIIDIYADATNYIRLERGINGVYAAKIVSGGVSVTVATSAQILGDVNLVLLYQTGLCTLYINEVPIASTAATMPAGLIDTITIYGECNSLIQRIEFFKSILIGDALDKLNAL